MLLRMMYNGWQPVVRTALVGILAYAALVILLRVSGKRTLSKMNAFDLVVTVALGSTLATVLLSRSVALVQGVAAFVVLVLLQLIVTWSSIRWPAIRRAVRSEPSLLYHGGQFLTKAMRSERVTEQEVWQAVRSQGICSMESVAAVVLETDGNFSVLTRLTPGKASTLKDVRTDEKDEPVRGSVV